MNIARVARVLSLPLCALTLALAPAIGCTGDEVAAPGEQVDAKNVRVTAADLAKLRDGETLKVDLGASDVLYHFYFDRALDYGKIALQLEDGSEALMSTALADLLASPYSPHEASNKSFVLTARAENLSGLTAQEIEILRNDGMLVKERIPGGVGDAKPLAEDNCITQIVYQTIYVNGQEVICELKILICDGEMACSDVKEFDGHDYVFCNHAKSWDAATAYCDKFNMNLVTINTINEEGWLHAMANMFSTQKWWIGYNDQAVEGSWVWQSGESSNYVNWAPGEPNNAGGNEGCAQLNRFYPDHGWNDEPCNLHYRFICESN
ncbi:C-type lectin domain-containing protein [Chondromyces crocatus]|uniref:C-type lectin domain-containing protein n=1 Tax=Chondromyces crocatus TaxID=52 RepID=A0A0K1EFR0_CHOCO|nr:C-type lectin domain-containing protein [Chondromyces crocatus]AKT39679.1 uncharacterized protein CMC5_038280 [Chondromyces crocatus]